MIFRQDFDAVNAGDGKAEAWVITFTRQLRVRLPQGKFILTHARMYPVFALPYDPTHKTRSCGALVIT